MPIYEYRCEANHIFSKMQPIDKDNKFTDCPECGALSNRIYSRFGISLKGNGFYRNSR